MSTTYSEAAGNGAISLVIAVVITYLVSRVIPTSDLSWALIAVVFASFFSGFFSSYYGE